jgi:hypothetical protein
MLFDVAADPHEAVDLAATHPAVLARGQQILTSWIGEQLGRSALAVDPLQAVLAEGGPYHVRGHLPAYLDRLRGTGRSGWADDLVARYGREADDETWIDERAAHRRFELDMAGFAR